MQYRSIRPFIVNPLINIFTTLSQEIVHSPTYEIMDVKWIKFQGPDIAPKVQLNASLDTVVGEWVRTDFCHGGIVKYHLAVC